MNDTILEIKWTKEDFLESLADEGLSEAELEKLLTPDNLRRLEEQSIERGWEVIRSQAEKLHKNIM